MAEEIQRMARFGAIFLAVVFIMALIAPPIITNYTNDKLNECLSKDPVCYLDGEVVDPKNLKLSAYEWEYDESNNSIRFAPKQNKRGSLILPIVLP